jgi:DNA primase
VASQGTAFTEDHTRILKRYTDSVILVFDPDTAGQDAAMRTSATFMASELAVKVATLPKGDDPDSFIRKNGAAAFGDKLKKAESAVAFQIAVLSSRQDADSEVGTMRIAKAVLQTIAQSPSAVQQAKLIDEAAQKLNIPAAALREDFRTMTGRSSRATAPRAGEPEAKPAERPVEEVTLCEHMIHIKEFPILADLVRRFLPLEIMSDAACRSVIKASLESAKTGCDILDVLRDEADESGELQKFAAELLVMPKKLMDEESSNESALKDIIRGIWRRELKRERGELDKRSDADLGRKELERRSQLTHYLKALGNWDDGSLVIEMELAGRKKSGE